MTTLPVNPETPPTWEPVFPNGGTPAMSMLIEPPAEYTGSEPSLFLAGGITGCPNWQAIAGEILSPLGLPLLNPRRKNFPIHDPDASRQQIEWEYRHLRRAAAILFWFPCETLCPIVLYELGAWSMTDKPIVVGTHPDYQRRRDVEIQTALARPNVKVAETLDELCEQAGAVLTQLYGKH